MHLLGEGSTGRRPRSPFSRGPEQPLGSPAINVLETGGCVGAWGPEPGLGLLRRTQGERGALQGSQELTQRRSPAGIILISAERGTAPKSWSAGAGAGKAEQGEGARPLRDRS